MFAGVALAFGGCGSDDGDGDGAGVPIGADVPAEERAAEAIHLAVTGVSKNAARCAAKRLAKERTDEELRSLASNIYFLDPGEAAAVDAAVARCQLEAVTGGSDRAN